MASTENSGVGKVKGITPLLSPHFNLMMAGRLMPLLALFAATILYAHALKPETYALYQSIWMYVNLVGVIIGFGVTTVIFSSRASALKQFIRKNKRIIFTFYSALWIVTFLIFSLASHQYSTSLKIWVIIFMMLQASNTITESWLIKTGGEIRYCAINFVYGIAFFLWHYLVLQSGFDIEWLIKGIICFSAAKFLALITFSIKRPLQFPAAMVDQRLFNHWAFNGANDILSVLSKWIDKLILIYLLTASEFAIFFNGSIEIPLFSIILGFTGSLMMAQMAERLVAGEPIIPVFRENFLLLSTVAFPLFFFLFFFSKPVFLLLFGPQYLASVPVFLITILILPLRINTYGGILQVLGKGNLVTKGSVIDLVLCIIFILIFYPMLGMRGAAMAMVISTVIQIIFYLWKSKKLLNASLLQMIPVKALLVRFGACGILFWLLQFLINDYTPLFKIICGSILILICILIIGKKYFTQILRVENQP